MILFLLCFQSLELLGVIIRTRRANLWSPAALFPGQRLLKGNVNIKEKTFAALTYISQCFG